MDLQKCGMDCYIVYMMSARRGQLIVQRDLSRGALVVRLQFFHHFSWRHSIYMPATQSREYMRQVSRIPVIRSVHGMEDAIDASS